MSNFNKPQCGEIWMCDLTSAGQCVQTGYRPVFIVSNNMNNTHSSILNVIPLTSKSKKNIPVHVELDKYEKFGLKTKSIMLVEQITTVSSNAMDKYVGKISDCQTLDMIRRAMIIQFPLFAK